MLVVGILALIHKIWPSTARSGLTHVVQMGVEECSLATTTLRLFLTPPGVTVTHVVCALSLVWDSPVPQSRYGLQSPVRQCLWSLGRGLSNGGR